MLTIVLINDGTGDDTTGHYRAVVAINTVPVWRGRIDDHHRPSGWRALLGRLAVAVREEGEDETS